ncbi:MAG: bifunctional nuclease family protein [Deltaproteobacteria bacterium]|nr:bifunctional nuclease family protein [Deltaproteobacteria bacterium]MBW2065438.1 bifunctional nuclease family protein [Deltaproteobacteria bacterium]
MRKKALVIIIGIFVLGGTYPLAGNEDLVRVRVSRLVMDPVSRQPVLMLSDPKEMRALPIWIDLFTANAIQSELQEVEHPRPLTHDLLERVIEQSGLEVKQITITHLEEGVYYARVGMDRQGSRIDVDARPSDSIVIALKFKAPIYVSKHLFDEKSILLKESKGIEETYGLRTQPLTPSLSRAFSFGSTRGLLVADVLRDSAAESDGLMRGDILVEVGEYRVEDQETLRTALERSGAYLRARVFRKGRFLTLELHPK